MLGLKRRARSVTQRAADGEGIFERGLTTLIRKATQRTANGEAWPWGPILVVAYLMRRSLRYQEPSQTLRLDPGDEVTISVHEPDR